ncbi:MAG: trk system potassium uptake protein TrkH, partial [Halanaerobium sp. T82-1]
MKYKNLLISRYFLISKYIGVIIMFAGGAILSPLLFLMAYPEEAALAPHFLLAAGLSILIGFVLYIYGNKHQ